MKLFVTEKVVRKYIKEIMDNPPGLGWQMTGDLSTSPVSVSSVVDSSAALTDPGNPKFVPTNRVELQTVLATLVNDVPDDEISGFYNTIKDTIEDINKDEDEMSKEDKKVEETIRASIRNMIKESKAAAIPHLTLKEFWQHSINEAGLTSGFLSSADREEMSHRVAKMPPPGNPNNVVPTKYPAGVSGRAGAAEKEPTKPSEGELKALRELLNRMELSAEDMQLIDSIKTEKETNAAIALALAKVPDADAVRFCNAFNKTKELFRDGELSDADAEILTRDSSITQLATFKTLFGKNLEAYALKLGIEVRQIFAGAGQKKGERGYLSKSGSETLAGTAAALGPDQSTGKNWSVSQVNKISQSALGKYILALKCVVLRLTLDLNDYDDTPGVSSKAEEADEIKINRIGPENVNIENMAVAIIAGNKIENQIRTMGRRDMLTDDEKARYDALSEDWLVKETDFLKCFDDLIVDKKYILSDDDYMKISGLIQVLYKSKMSKRESDISLTGIKLNLVSFIQENIK